MTDLLPHPLPRPLSALLDYLPPEGTWYETERDAWLVLLEHTILRHYPANPSALDVIAAASVEEFGRVFESMAHMPVCGRCDAPAVSARGSGDERAYYCAEHDPEQANSQRFEPVETDEKYSGNMPEPPEEFNYSHEPQPTDPDADDETDEEETAPDAAAIPPLCTCPEWWRESGAWRQTAAEVPGYHHHESCGLYDRDEPPPTRELVCRCDGIVRNQPHFKENRPSHAHSMTCPLYKEGAHHWLIPNGASQYVHYVMQCAWCPAERVHDPAAVAEAQAKQGPTPGRCPRCGHGYRSAEHRRCKMEEATVD